MHRISIILPVFNEAAGIETTIIALDKIFSELKFEKEYILVDDGSTDNTWSIIKKLTSSRQCIHAVSLSRNFGKENAILAGIRATTSGAAIVMDADLQHPPEIIPQLIEKWKQTNCDVVHAVKSGRQNESDSNSFLVRVFYVIYRLTTGTSLEGASDFKLLNRRALDTYASLKERDLFFRGLIPWIGFHQETITFTVSERLNGTTKWGPIKRVVTAIFAITSFSTLPLQIVTLVGIVFLLGTFFLGAYTLYEWWLGAALEGFTTIILLLLTIGSTLMISLGIIGQYIARIYDEVKGRPAFIVKEEIGSRH